MVKKLCRSDEEGTRTVDVKNHSSVAHSNYSGRRSSCNSPKRRLLIINVCNPLSMGGAAITSVLVKLLRDNIPDATISLMPSRWRDRDLYVKEYGMKNVAFIPHLWYNEKYSTSATLIHSAMPALSVSLRLLVSSFLRKLKHTCSNPLDKYDAIIDLNSDAINMHYGMVFPLYTLFNLFLASLSGKPVIVCPCTIGRFKRPLRFIAMFVLNRMTLIMVREAIGRKNLKCLGVSKPSIAVVSDFAFLFLGAQNKEELAGIRLEELERPLVGIAPSQEISRYAFVRSRESVDLKYEKYVRLMAQIADFVIKNLNASVILIPHSLSEKSTARYRWLEDRTVCERIYEGINNKNKARLTNGPIRPDELKALIGACDLFIGCRMHATIASTSSMVPTVAVAYGEKFEGIIGRQMAQQNRIVNIGQDYEVVADELKSKILSTWKNRDYVRQTLKQRLELVRRSSLSAIPLIQESLKRNVQSRQ